MISPLILSPKISLLPTFLFDASNSLKIFQTGFGSSFPSSVLFFFFALLFFNLRLVIKFDYAVIYIFQNHLAFSVYPFSFILSRISGVSQSGWISFSICDF